MCSCWLFALRSSLRCQSHPLKLPTHQASLPTHQASLLSFLSRLLHDSYPKPPSKLPPKLASLQASTRRTYTHLRFPPLVQPKQRTLTTGGGHATHSHTSSRQRYDAYQARLIHENRLERQRTFEALVSPRFDKGGGASGRHALAAVMAPPPLHPLPLMAGGPTCELEQSLERAHHLETQLAAERTRLSDRISAVAAAAAAVNPSLASPREMHARYVYGARRAAVDAGGRVPWSVHAPWPGGWASAQKQDEGAGSGGEEQAMWRNQHPRGGVHRRGITRQSALAELKPL